MPVGRQSRSAFKGVEKQNSDSTKRRAEHKCAVVGSIFIFNTAVGSTGIPEVPDNTRLLTRCRPTDTERNKAKLKVSEHAESSWLTMKINPVRETLFHGADRTSIIGWFCRETAACSAFRIFRGNLQSSKNNSQLNYVILNGFL
jgi:hypothetical protein